MTIDDDQLATWARITEAATEGPWEANIEIWSARVGSNGVSHQVKIGPYTSTVAVTTQKTGDVFRYSEPFDRGLVHEQLVNPKDEPVSLHPDATFIATARAAMPALIEECRRLREESVRSACCFDNAVGIKQMQAERDAARDEMGKMAMVVMRLRDAQARAEAAERSLAASEREADRLRHGVPVEGDYVCPDSLRAYSAEKRVTELEHQLAGFDHVSYRDIKRLEAKVDTLESALRQIERLLTNLQPHIPQSCYPGHERFIDNYVDPALDTARAALGDEP